MTTTEPASLDAILRAATPVEAEPFNLGRMLRRFRFSRIGQSLDVGQDIARYVNSLRVDTERARALAVALEQECAAKDTAIAEALGYLTDALVWCNSDNTADCIGEAIAALMGDES